MDEFLRVFGRLVSQRYYRFSDCTLDCTIEQMKWPDFLFLGLIFLMSFAFTRKVIAYYKNKTD